MSRRHRSSAAEGPVYAVTSADEAPGDDLSRRTRRYLWSMGIRTACFLAAVFIDSWIRWPLAIGAIVLPYVAVVMANASQRRRMGSSRMLDAPPRESLSGSAETPPTRPLTNPGP